MTEPKTASKTYYWLCDYSDEITPCAPTLAATAQWLSQPDLQWGRETAAQEGQRFAAIVADVVWIGGVYGGDRFEYDTPPPKNYRTAALCEYPDGGWSAEDLVDADHLTDLLTDNLNIGDRAAIAFLCDERFALLCYSSGPPPSLAVVQKPAAKT